MMKKILQLICDYPESTVSGIFRSTDTPGMEVPMTLMRDVPALLKMTVPMTFMRGVLFAGSGIIGACEQPSTNSQ